MRTATLIRRSLRYYWRTGLATALGVATAVAVLAGARLVGDSVRASLRDLAVLRLGRADYVVSAAGFFREALATDLQSHPQFPTRFARACPMIALEGFVTHEASGRRAADVLVYGIDERFWQFHGRPAPGAEMGRREALLSPGLAAELGSIPGDVLLLRVEQPASVPAGSLYGRKDTGGKALRVSTRATLPAAHLGEFSIRPQQGAVRAVFVPLRDLQRDLERPDRVNAVLVAEAERRTADTGDGAADGEGRETAAARALHVVLDDTFQLEDFGLVLRPLDVGRGLALESDSGFLSDVLAARATEAAAQLGLPASSILTYLATRIRSGDREVPYSLVTAIDLQTIAGIHAVGPPRQAAIVLNTWAARELRAVSGDEVQLEYYIWHDDGRLLTRAATFRVAAHVPIEGIAADRDLTPRYPGITNAGSLASWDPPFPIDLSRVRLADEQYWDQYGTTPKAFVTLEAGQALWQSRFGKMTSLRIVPPADRPVPVSADGYRARLRAALDPIALGASIYPARAQALHASRGATDFGVYFTAFSLFLVLSALLLAGLFFRLGLEHRLRELGVLRAIGFPVGTIRALFLAEGATLAFAGAVAGVAGGLAYGGLMMFGLRTWWIDAVGSTNLTLHWSAGALATGAIGGVVAALASVAWTLRAIAAASPRGLLAGSWGAGRVKFRIPAFGFRGGGRTDSARAGQAVRSAIRGAVAFGALGSLLALAASLQWVGPAAGFFGAGTGFLGGLLCACAAWLRRPRPALLHGSGWWAICRLGFRSATDRAGRSVLCIALIASATFVIVAVGAFRREDVSSLEPKSGTGGFPMLATAMLPLRHDLNTPEGREAVGLDVESAALQGVTLTPFRVRPGDDASCLNLYEPRNPRILAAAGSFLRSGRFAFEDALADTPEERENPWLLLDREAVEGVVPVAADANSMAYALHRRLGEEVVIAPSGGQPIRLRLVAALSDSIFQGELIMSERHFLRLFPGHDGFRFFLIDAPAGQSAAIARVLEHRLSDFGVDVMATSDRLAMFHRVEHTYLSTFQTLGGLGLLLGTIGLATVLLQNVLERRRELALLRAVGYRRAHLAVMVMAENALLLVCGMACGAICALLAVAPAVATRGGRPAQALAWLLPAVFVCGLAASVVATRAVSRLPLIEALKAE